MKHATWILTTLLTFSLLAPKPAVARSNEVRLSGKVISVDLPTHVVVIRGAHHDFTIHVPETASIHRGKQMLMLNDIHRHLRVTMLCRREGDAKIALDVSVLDGVKRR
jgi:hypothetical protein